MMKQNGFQFNAREGTWSLTKSGDDIPAILNAGCRLQVNDHTYTLAQADDLTVTASGSAEWNEEKYKRTEVIATFEKPAFNWTLLFDVSSRETKIRISSIISNYSENDLTLGDCGLFVIEHAADGVLKLGAQPENQRIFAFNGGLGTQYVKQITAEAGSHTTAFFQHIYNPDAQQAMLAGFVTFDRMRTTFTCQFDSQKKTTDCVGSCRFQNYVLKPSASIESEMLNVELSEDPYALLTRWADLVSRHYQPRIWNKPPPVGAVSGVWTDIRVEIHEERVPKSLTAVRERLNGFGVDYFWISISNLKDGLPGNWLEFNDQAFPRGFEKTLKKIIDAGMKPGLWTGLFYINGAAETFSENRDNLYRDHKTGKPIPRGRWLWAHKAKDGAEPLNYMIDCSHPRSLKFLEKIYATYREWGVRYYMLDFLDPGPIKDEFMHMDYYDQTMIRGPGIPRQGMLTARREARADTHLLTASGSNLALTTGTVDTMRIGLDYGEGRGLQPRFPSYPGKYLINGSYGSSGSPQDNCLQNTAAYFFTHRKLFLNGQNMLTVDHPIPRNEAEFSATLFGMTGSPIILGDALDRISEDRLGMIKKVLPRPTDWPFPADFFKRVWPDDYSRVLAVPVKTEWGEWTVVAVFNLDERAAATEITLKELRLPKNKKFRVWDFWQEKYCGWVEDNLEVEVPARSCRLLRFVAATPQPEVLSTDMHTRQGQLELQRVVWDQQKHTLSGTAIRPKGETGNLYLIAPPGWKLADYTGIFVAKDANDGALIIRKPLAFKRGRVNWSVGFLPLDEEEKRWQRKHAEARGAQAQTAAERRTVI